MKNPKIRFEELKQEIEYKKSELAKKRKEGRHAQFDYRIKVLEAEMKGIAETMEYIAENGID